MTDLVVIVNSDQQPHIAHIGFNQEQWNDLGEILFIELPKINSKKEKGSLLLELEAEKAVLSYTSPVSGTVIKTANEQDIFEESKHPKSDFFSLVEIALDVNEV